MPNKWLIFFIRLIERNAFEGGFKPGKASVASCMYGFIVLVVGGRSYLLR